MQSISNIQLACVDGRTVIKKIRVNVRFGSLKQNCRGNGICSVEVMTGSELHTGCAQSVAMADILVTLTKELYLRVIKHSASAHVHRRHFSTGSFIMDEDYKLPKTVMQKLYPVIPGKIVKGSYAVQETPEYYIIRLS